MKFKTLKDIEDKHLDCTPIFLAIGMREEARKQLDYKFAMALNAPDEGTKDFLLGQCAFIEEFFNIDKNDVSKQEGVTDGN